jgi:hypothetical protein
MGARQGGRGMPRRLMLLVVSILLASVAAAAAVLPAVAVGSGTGPAQAAPADDPSLRDAVARDLARIRGERAGLASPAAHAARARSRRAYSGLDRSAVSALIERTIPSATVAQAPLRLLPGERLVRYEGSHAASVVLPNGKRGVIDSMVPLRAQAAGGELAPVDLRLRDRGGAFAPAVPVRPVAIDKRLSGGVTLTDSGVGLVALASPGSTPAGGAQVGDAVVFADAGPDSDIVARPVVAGAEILAVLRSSLSPEDFAFRVTMPDAARLRSSDGGAQVVDGGEVLATILPPVSFDADHQPVPTALSVVGDELRVHVAHSGADIRYPVTLDPTMSDYKTWHNNPPQPLGGWYASGEPDFSYQFINNDNPSRWGNGPYILPRCAGCSLGAGATGDWVYVAQGTSAIATLTEHDVVTDANGGSFCTFGGIASDLNYSAWKAGPTANCVEDAGMSLNFTDPSPNAGNVARFGLTSPGGCGCPFDYDGYMGFAIITIQDNDTPTVTATPVPSGWHRNSDGSTVAFAAHDGGVGVRSQSISATGWSGASKSDYCDPDRLTQCPMNTSLSTTIAGMLDGINTVTGGASDSAGSNGSTTAAVKVDNTAPTVVYGGDVPTAPSGVLTPGKHNLTVNATDGVRGGAAAQQRSGVKIIQITDTDQPGTHDQTVTQGSCTGYGCPASTASCAGDSCPLSTTYTLDTTDGTWSGGSHHIKVTAKDVIDNTAPSQTYPVSVGGLPLPAAGCDRPLVDGYDAGTYVSVKYAQAGSQTRVCLQVANGSTVNKDAVVTIDSGSASAELPRVDPANNSDVCSTTTPNAAPGQHPVLDVTLAGTQRIMLDTYSGSGEAWVCVQVGSQKVRVIVPVPSLNSPPSVNVAQDAPPPAPPPLTPWPTGPSATCSAGNGPMLVDSTYGPLALWLAHYEPNGSTADLCVRTQGPMSLGGVLSVNTNPSDGVHPVLQQGSDWNACNGGQSLIDMDSPRRLHVKLGPVGNPATVCIDDGSVRTYTVGTTGSGAPTYVSWTPDPGTPIPPASA